ncbi:ABC transporter ATP-binding protein [Heliophilum fasciatum]|uniref:NitT/TauT family transport system ATP-binding protein n=1 Tax=Heliophilum fasciatum TaxID=35700 RepID=A0A4R2RW47_9FIRM|nr:ABC transporter ATP-binding protein [Heliophilum fasciatum]MCW2278111.1 NitT/TauT family transport system ATP-binding protein [Heliophilum fasciatum]TCP64181.1 NitT/TauT family transport system ATP-binding protein [Heliophilum fasciatum]
MNNVKKVSPEAELDPRSRDLVFQMRGVSKSFPTPEGPLRLVLDDVNLDIQQGEFVCLLGPSGCGKTTVMNLLARFITPTSGTLLVHGEPLVAPNPKHVTIFQEHGLFPWRTVIDNVAFGVQAQGASKSDAREKAIKYLELVGLQEVATLFPHQLSGGMRQRVAIARALAVEPEVIFMDEPFSALDAFTRYRLQDEMLRIWQDQKTTIIFVTHDIDEAVYLGQKVVVMAPNPGRIEMVLPMNIARPCERTDSQFLYYRREIFKAFQLVHEWAPEYAI